MYSSGNSDLIVNNAIVEKEPRTFYARLSGPAPKLTDASPIGVPLS